LYEFAVMLPLLLIMVVGIADLGAAMTLRDKLTNAVREGTRIAIGQPTADLLQPNPMTVQAVRDAVVNYLNDTGLQVTLSGSAPCASALFSWTYCFTNSGQMVIERQYLFTSGSTLVIATRVTVRHPFQWTLGPVVGLFQSGSFSGPSMISSRSVMENLQ